MVNQQLADYINQQISQNTPKEVILSTLLSQGWQEADINEAFSKTDSGRFPTENSSSSATNSKSKIIISSLIILILFFISAAIYMQISNNKTNLDSKVVVQKNQQLSIPQSSQLLPTTTTYNNAIVFNELEINLPKEKGNSADVYLPFIDAWDQKYKNKKEEEIFLDTNDQNAILSMASKKKFSLYPEHFSVPSSSFDILSSTMNGNKLVLKIVVIYKRVIATADQLALQEKTNEEEKLLQSLVTIGRQFQDSSFCTIFQDLAGSTVEIAGVKKLKEFYQKNNNAAKATLFDTYLQKISNVSNQNKERRKKFVSNNIIILTLFATSLTNSVAMNSDSIYKQDGTSPQEFQSWLGSLKTLDNLSLELEEVMSLTVLKNAKGIEPERSIAENILVQYSKSPNQYIADYSKKGLDMSAQEVMEWFKKNAEK